MHLEISNLLSEFLIQFRRKATYGEYLKRRRKELKSIRSSQEYETGTATSQALSLDLGSSLSTEMKLL
jgi:hypothetical protein